MFGHVKFFLKNTFYSTKLQSIKAQTEQAEGTKHKHPGKKDFKMPSN